MENKYWTYLTKTNYTYDLYNFINYHYNQVINWLKIIVIIS